GWQENTLLPDPSGAAHCDGSGADNDHSPITMAGACQGLFPGAPCSPPDAQPGYPQYGFCHLDGVFCDPQLGCSSRLVAQDLSDEKSWQFSQEFRLASNFNGPFNFSAGGNYLHYETEENYYVFINTLTHLTTAQLGGSQNQQAEWVPGVSDNSQCLPGGFVDV